MPVDWLTPNWPAPAGVHALCTARSGGVSTGPYASCNLGDHVGDDPAAVQANRTRLTDALRLVTPGASPVFLKQVHGNGVVALVPSTADGAEADACVTTSAGVACTIMVADCLPVLLTHTSGAVVAAAHAGWRGLAGQGAAQHPQGVLEAVFERFSALGLDLIAPDAISKLATEGKPASSAVAAETLAWLGPCIGPSAFEVGGEVREAFCATNPAAAACFVPRAEHPGKFLCDLAGLARLRLQALGITRIYGNNSSAPWCTVTNASRFFSHRHGSAHGGGSGRFAACIWKG
ncbi:polyphenol oxidase family protein [Acidovorax sp. RAC01]|uniref:polyphenol oxidase family protein n=1 Tax=Acidovorax sp. RAC01 TaxID=1842533 RepID=UPI0009F27151|nr:laccase domain-containing protein [Acidovorax sp. RAC01]